MLKSSLVKISYVSLGNVFNAVLGLAFLSAVAKTLTLEQFGKYALLTSFLIFGSKIMDFGTNSIYVARSISKAHNLFQNIISTRLLLFVVTLPIAFIGLLLLDLFSLRIMIPFVIGLFFYGINYTLFGIFQKEEKFLHAVTINTIPAVIKGIFAALIIFGVINPDLDACFIVFALSIGTSILFLPLIPKHNFANFKFDFDLTFIKDSIPAGISMLVADGWSAVSNAVAKFSGSFVDVGVFSLADKISNIFSLLSLSIFTVILPKNAGRKRENLKYDFTETLIISVLILILAVSAIFASQIFITWFFGDKFSGSIQILDILIFSSAITAIYSFMRDFFFIEEKTAHLLSITLTRLTTFIVLALVLSLSYGIMGVAVASLISAVIALGLTVYYVRK